MADHRFPKSARLLRPPEFQRVFDGNCVAADGWIVVYALPGLQTESRLGLVVSRKCGNAVVRNRWKRLLREAFRVERAQFPQVVDLVVLPRRGREPDLASLQKSFQRLVKKLTAELPRAKGASNARDPALPS